MISSSKTTTNQNTNSKANDKDLVELAGYHAYRYRNHDLGDSMKVNGTEFEVIHTIYESETGLDALTVQNFETKELTIVYVGSEQPKEDWIDTNLPLPNRITPAQLEAVRNTY